MTEPVTPRRPASRCSRPAYGPPPTSSSAASGTAARTCGQARIRVSCPLRGTRRDTQTTTGRPARAVGPGPQHRPGRAGRRRRRRPAQPGHPRGRRRGQCAGEPHPGVFAEVGDRSPRNHRCGGAAARAGQHRPARLVPVGDGDQPPRRPAAARARAGRAARPRRTAPCRSRGARAAGPPGGATDGTGSIRDVGWRRPGTAGPRRSRPRPPTAGA